MEEKAIFQVVGEEAVSKRRGEKWVFSHGSSSG